jgi:hypothetical protein
MIADVLESSTPVLELNLVPDLVPWEDGDDEAFRDGVAISIGDVVVIVSSAYKRLTAMQNRFGGEGEGEDR